MFILKGTHPNPLIRQAVAEYGPLWFDVTILEVCSRGDLDRRELYWFDTLKPNFNRLRFVQRKAGKRKVSKSLIYS